MRTSTTIHQPTPPTLRPLRTSSKTTKKTSSSPSSSFIHHFHLPPSYHRLHHLVTIHRFFLSVTPLNHPFNLPHPPPPQNPYRVPPRVNFFAIHLKKVRGKSGVCKSKKAGKSEKIFGSTTNFAKWLECVCYQIFWGNKKYRPNQKESHNFCSPSGTSNLKSVYYPWRKCCDF